MRQYQLSEPGQPEHVHVELAAGLGQRNVLDRAECAVSGVVDQYVDTPALGDDAGNQRGERRVVGDVETHRDDAVFRERRHEVDPPSYRVHTVTLGVQSAGDRRADTRRCSGDNGDFGAHGCSLG